MSLPLNCRRIRNRRITPKINKNKKVKTKVNLDPSHPNTCSRASARKTTANQPSFKYQEKATISKISNSQ